MLVDAQSHLHKVQAKTYFETTILIKLFGFSTFYVIFGFLTHKKEKIDQK